MFVFVKKPWDIEEFIDQRRSSDGYKNYNDRNWLKITTRVNQFSSESKSKSENDISQGFLGNKWCKENDDDSTSPSDSNITIVRVQRRSLAQKIIRTKPTLEGILGDGSHLANSPSMVNLATVFQRYDGTSIISKNDRLVSLSSWDGNEIPVSTVSDSGIYVSRLSEKDARASLLSFAAWKRYCLPNKERKAIEMHRADINDETILESAPLHHEFTNMTGNPRKVSREIENYLQEDEISYDLDLSREKNKNGSKLSKRMEKAFRRFVQCSWVSGGIKKRNGNK